METELLETKLKRLNDYIFMYKKLKSIKNAESMFFLKHKNDDSKKRILKHTEIMLKLEKSIKNQIEQI
jgi:hypothetical protein